MNCLAVVDWGENAEIPGIRYDMANSEGDVVGIWQGYGRIGQGMLGIG